MNKLILTNISELVTCSGTAPKSGTEMSDARIINNGCIVIENELISAVGSTEEILKQYDAGNYQIIDCTGKAVLPGFVDSHTHFVFGGYRQDEFALRLKGASYMDIQKSGGGIVNTVNSTREATLEELVETGKKRADSMLVFGVTTVEGKSGYGLDKDTEIKQLRVLKLINEEHLIDVVPTFLGAHSVPPEFKGKVNEFLDFLISEVLPVVKEEKLAKFVDVFCEKSVFDIEQSRRYLTKAKELGFKLKLHADEIVGIGGAELGVELKVVSTDHLLQISEKGIRELAESGVIATLLPATAFCLKEEYADARKMIDNGCAVALATDYNPGSGFTNSIPLVIALAAINMHMNVNEIVNALTINGACALDMQDKIGSIEKGKQADIIILEYPSIDFLTYHTGINIVNAVIKKGKVIIGA